MIKNFKEMKDKWENVTFNIMIIGKYFMKHNDFINLMKLQKVSF